MAFSPANTFTFYPADVDGSPAAFVVDLEQEPRPTHPSRITVSVSMLEPEPDGLRSEGEMEELDGLLTRIAPGATGKDKQFKLELLDKSYGTTSITAIGQMRPEEIRRGYKKIMDEAVRLNVARLVNIEGKTRFVVGKPEEELIEG